MVKSKKIDKYKLYHDRLKQEYIHIKKQGEDLDILHGDLREEIYKLQFDDKISDEGLKSLRILSNRLRGILDD